MPDEPEDATSDSSTDPEDANASQETEEGASSTPEQEVSSPTPQQQGAKEGAAAPEGFVPKQNVEGEVRRRLSEELGPMVQQAVRDALQSQKTETPQTPQQPAQPQYTIEQLDAWEEEYPQYRQFIRQERNKILREQAKSDALSALRAETQNQRMEREKQESLVYISQTYEDAFTLLPTGQRTWNTASPLYQRAIAIYQSEPSLQKIGRGLSGAFDAAYGQLAREERMKTQKEKVRATQKQRRAEKTQNQAMAGGATNAAPAQSGPAPNVKLKKLMEEHKKKGGGDPKLMAEILRQRGLMHTEA